MLIDPEAQRAYKRHYYKTVERPRILELRVARIEGRTPRSAMFPKNPRQIQRETPMRELKFSTKRTQPLPAHPPIRTVWQSVAAWEVAA
jgi:hypothetical protein